MSRNDWASAVAPSHRRTVTRSIAVFAASLLATGCSTFLPYKDDFACKNKDWGKCIHPADAYREAAAATAPDATKDAGETRATAPRRNRRDAPPLRAGYEGYTEASYAELASLIEQPVAPMVAPARTVRTLILAYSDKGSSGRLYMPRFVYSVLEGPRFVLGDYLVAEDFDFANVVASGMFTGPNGEAAPAPKIAAPEGKLEPEGPQDAVRTARRSKTEPRSATKTSAPARRGANDLSAESSVLME